MNKLSKLFLLLTLAACQSKMSKQEQKDARNEAKGPKNENVN